MPLQVSDTVELGQIKVCRLRNQILNVPHIGASVVVTLYDMIAKIGACAHIVLPESALGDRVESDLSGKYADLAIPAMIQAFTAEGGQTAQTTVRMVGGAQLFNFGGGSGNLLNIGSRNATAIRTALSRHGLVVEKAEIGGNKARSLTFIIANGNVIVRTIGGDQITI